MAVDSKDDSKTKGCKAAFGMSLRVAYIAAYMLGFFLVVFLCNFLHILLRPLSQPRMISEFIVILVFPPFSPSLFFSLYIHVQNLEHFE